MSVFLARVGRARVPLILASMIFCAPAAHAQSPGRVVISDMRIMRPFVVQVIAQEQWTRDERCVVRRVWHGRLSPTDGTGKRVSGRLAYFDFYVSHDGMSGCAIQSSSGDAGRCDLQNHAQYDVVADVSAVDVPDDANGTTLAAFAAGSSRARLMYDAQRIGTGDDAPVRRVLRPRLKMRAALVRGTLKSSNPCLTTTVDQGQGMADALAGQWIPFPPFFVSTETESGRRIYHWLGGENAIIASAWWTAGLRDVPEGKLAVSGRDPDLDDEMKSKRPSPDDDLLVPLGPDNGSNSDDDLVVPLTPQPSKGKVKTPSTGPARRGRP